jgi:hypothetical protein
VRNQFPLSSYPEFVFPPCRVVTVATILGFATVAASWSPLSSPATTHSELGRDPGGFARDPGRLGAPARQADPGGFGQSARIL